MGLKKHWNNKMEKTHKFKTLKGLVSKTQQYSFNAFLSGRMCHNKEVSE